MAENGKQKLTAKERQIARIEQLKAQLQKEEAKLKAEARKERNGQLVALGIFFEHAIQISPNEAIEGMTEEMKSFLSGKTLDRALAAVERVMKEKNKNPSKPLQQELKTLLENDQGKN